ncbi:MAG: type II toxin-antitoxin system Phd/YefM family antitoxin [Rhodoferax sp.]
MEMLQIREAKVSFSALVAAAEKGRPTLVSRHGQPCADLLIALPTGRPEC